MTTDSSLNDDMFTLLLEAMKAEGHDTTIALESVSMDETLSAIGIDSVRAIEIAAYIEGKLGVSFPDDQLARSRSVRDLVELLVRYGRHAA